MLYIFFRLMEDNLLINLSIVIIFIAFNFQNLIVTTLHPTA